jgi:hypothetical protein
VRTVRQWVDETAGGLPRQFWYLWGTTLVNRIGSFVLVVLALYLTKERGFSESYAGLVIGLWGAGGAVGTLIGGVLADRWGRKPTYLTALFGGATMMLVVGFTRGQVAITVAVFLLGMVSEASRPAAVALMIDLVPERDRMRAFSLNYWVINLGFAVSAFLAGILAGVDFRLLFVIDAATTVAAATLIVFAIKEPVRHRVAVLHRARWTAHGLHRPRLHGLRGREPADVADLHAAPVVAAAVDEPRRAARLDLRHGDRAQRRAHRGRAAVRAAPAPGPFARERAGGRGGRVRVGFGLTAFADTAVLYAWTRAGVDGRGDAELPANSATNAALSPAHLRGRYQGVFSAVLVGGELPGPDHRGRGCSTPAPPPSGWAASASPSWSRSSTCWPDPPATAAPPPSPPRPGPHLSGRARARARAAHRPDPRRTVSRGVCTTALEHCSTRGT